MDYQQLWTQTKDEISHSIEQFSFQQTFGEVKTVLKMQNGSIYVLCPNNLIQRKLNTLYINQLNDILETLTSERLRFKFVTSDEVAPKEEVTEKKKDYLFKSNLRPEYTFSSFVAGDSNKLARRNAFQCAQEGANAANPLYIFGGVGLGKTHLMQAIGNQMIDDDINKRVLYIETQEFIDDYTKAARSNKFDTFEEKYSNLDALLVDDIQMLSDAPRTQEQFFSIFNKMYNDSKLIVIASDKPYNKLNIMDRLTSRFSWGQIVDIEKPDQTLRVQILKRKVSETTPQIVPDEVLEFIASNFTSNIRELEGALRRVLAYAVAFDLDVTLDTAKEALKTLIKVQDKNNDNNDFEKLISIVADFYQVDVADILSSKRNAKFTTPRHICMYILKTKYELTFKKIGSLMGGRDYTTVITAVEKISQQMVLNKELELAITTILKKIG